MNLLLTLLAGVSMAFLYGIHEVLLHQSPDIIGDKITVFQWYTLAAAAAWTGLAWAMTRLRGARWMLGMCLAGAAVGAGVALLLGGHGEWAYTHDGIATHVIHLPAILYTATLILALIWAWRRPTQQNRPEPKTADTTLETGDDTLWKRPTRRMEWFAIAVLSLFIVLFAVPRAMIGVADLRTKAELDRLYSQHSLSGSGPAMATSSEEGALKSVRSITAVAGLSPFTRSASQCRIARLNGYVATKIKCSNSKLARELLEDCVNRQCGQFTSWCAETLELVSEPNDLTRADWAKLKSGYVQGRLVAVDKNRLWVKGFADLPVICDKSNYCYPTDWMKAGKALEQLLKKGRSTYVEQNSRLIPVDLKVFFARDVSPEFRATFMRGANAAGYHKVAVAGDVLECTPPTIVDVRAEYPYEDDDTEPIEKRYYPDDMKPIEDEVEEDENLPDAE